MRNVCVHACINEYTFDWCVGMCAAPVSTDLSNCYVVIGMYTHNI